MEQYIWAGGLDAALDVTITHPLQAATRAGAAATPGHAMTVAFENKCRDTEELCREQGIKFIPIVAESLGGWHKVALEQFRKLGSALARHTGQEGLTPPLISPSPILSRQPPELGQRQLQGML